MNNTDFELIIIGGGPAGVAAGVYAARKRIKTLLLTYSFESQSVVSEKIENWIGTIAISGSDFAKSMEAHLRAYAGESVAIQTKSKVKFLKKIASALPHEDVGFEVETEKGDKYTAKTVLIASGSVRRKLDAKGADIFEHKGLTYCATCDGPLYDGQDVLVIGGGNAAFETTAQLAAYCKSVTIINRGDTFRADPVTVEKVLSKPNVTAIKNAISLEVKGDKFVNGFVYKDATSGEEKELATTGIFVEIGLIANTSYAEGVVDRNPQGQVVVNPRTQESSTEGIWAAGDCTDGLYHQNNIATGDAVKALEDIYNYLHTK